jgi:hypothetical protein
MKMPKVLLKLILEKLTTLLVQLLFISLAVFGDNFRSGFLLIRQQVRKEFFSVVDQTNSLFKQFLLFH